MTDTTRPIQAACTVCDDPIAHNCPSRPMCPYCHGQAMAHPVPYDADDTFLARYIRYALRQSRLDSHSAR